MAKKLPIFERHSADGRLLGFQVKIRRKGFPTVSRQFGDATMTAAQAKAKAQEWAIQKLDEMNAGTFRDRREVERTTLREMLERYLAEITPHKKSARQETLRINAILKHPLADRTIASIRGLDIAKYRDERLATVKAGKPISGNTVRLDLALLSHLWTIMAKEWSLPVENPVRSITLPKLAKPRDRRLNSKADKEGKTEESRLLDAAAVGPHWLKPLILLAIETGMRLSEMLNLDWRDIDLDAPTATLHDTKNGDRRVVPLSKAAVGVINSLARPITGRGPVFAATIHSVEHHFDAARKTAGIVGLRFHDLRHEATSRFVDRGLSIVEVSAITGHKTLQMLKRYSHPDPKDLAKKLG